MLDADLAKIYQVETKRLNEAAKDRTENRFSSGLVKKLHIFCTLSHKNLQPTSFCRCLDGLVFVDLMYTKQNETKKASFQVKNVSLKEFT